jgi:uncharacterized protein DUF726
VGIRVNNLNPLPGWIIGKSIAENNGPKLANSISQYKNNCPDTDVRVIGHSLGAEVVRSTLMNLDKNQEWKDKGFKLRSVHLLGASIDNYIVDANSPLGQVISRQVDAFVNLYSPNDYVLTTAYWTAEANPGLGRGTKAGMTLPPNYSDNNVQEEIRPINDANGDGTKDFLVIDVEVGQNHFGFPGFRWEAGTLRDDGSMNAVVNYWMVQGHTGLQQNLRI